MKRATVRRLRVQAQLDRLEERLVALMNKRVDLEQKLADAFRAERLEAERTGKTVRS